MPLIKSALFFLMALTLFRQATGQSLPENGTPVQQRVSTFNPYGLFEPPMAIGAGIGYRLNERTEIWSETSLLTNGLMMYVGPLTGIRQIFQLKRFIGSDGHFFVAGEIRYKYFSYRDTADFSNPSINETIHNIPYHAYHTVFGAALQAGYRINLSKNGKFQVELTGGIGIKNKIIDRPGVPTGYTEYVTPSVDLNIYDFIESRGISIYFPGSIRVIYPFGKRIR